MGLCGLGLSVLWISYIGDAIRTCAAKIIVPMKCWTAIERCSKKVNSVKQILQITSTIQKFIVFYRNIDTQDFENT